MMACDKLHAAVRGGDEKYTRIPVVGSDFKLKINTYFGRGGEGGSLGAGGTRIYIGIYKIMCARGRNDGRTIT